MKGDSKAPNLVMLTTTHVPYVYHIPPILSCETGVPYWFRYQNIGLQNKVSKAKDNELRNLRGILYLRDNESLSKLCFPLRRFRVLWNENRQAVSFFYLEMNDLINYDLLFFDPEKGTLSSECRTNDISHVNLEREFQERSKSNMPFPKLERLAVPAQGEPPILTDRQLRTLRDFLAPEDSPNLLPKPIDDNAYVWEDYRSMFDQHVEVAPDRNTENNNWVNITRIFSNVKTLEMFVFWRVLRLQQLHRPKKFFLPQKIGKDDSCGFYTHGYSLLSNQAYGLEICQIIPKVFENEVFDMNQFNINIDSSDPGIEQITGREMIDGLYGRYELSFKILPRLSGDMTLLKLSCSQKLPSHNSHDASNVIPPTRMPIKIRTRRMKKFLFSILSLLFILMLFFHPYTYKEIFGEEINEVLSNILRTIFLWCGLYFAGVAGRNEILKSLSKLKS